MQSDFAKYYPHYTLQIISYYIMIMNDPSTEWIFELMVTLKLNVKTNILSSTKK